MNSLRPYARRISLLLTPVVLLAIALVGFAPAPTGASSHREAPLIASDPDADATDFYMFNSPTNPNNVVLIANYIPFSAPEGAPNFNSFSPNVLYEINIDTVGDGQAHVKYQFEFTTTRSSTPTFLYNTGAITSLADPDLHLRQTYKVTEVVTYGGPPTTTVLKSGIPVPPPNIGSKSTPNYAALVNEVLAAGQIGSGASQIKVFAGPRDDPFWVDLGSIFDVLSLRGQGPPPGPGYATGPTPGIDNLAGFNVYSLALEIPASRILAGAPAGETVIGGWTSASRRSTRVLSNITDVLGGTATGQDVATGPYVQVSRLGMPLVNEAVIPVQLKDAFNNLPPSLDQTLYTAPSGVQGQIGDLLQTSVENPELGRLLCLLYGVPMPKAPTSGVNKCNTPVNLSSPGSGRTDIFKIFLTGMTLTKPFTINTKTGPLPLAAGTVVNQPTKGSGIRAAEMLRLNTALKGDLCSPTPSRLGVLGSDACGFPNGRRLGDDVVEIELLAVAGAAYSVLAPDSFSFNPALLGVLTDSVDRNDLPYSSSFPYLATPHQGQEHNHSDLSRLRFPLVAN
jgi:hypothetical protein